MNRPSPPRPVLIVVIVIDLAARIKDRLRARGRPRGRERGRTGRLNYQPHNKQHLLQRVKRDDFQLLDSEHRFTGFFGGVELFSAAAPSSGDVKRVHSRQAVFFGKELRFIAQFLIEGLRHDCLLKIAVIESELYLPLLEGRFGQQFQFNQLRGAKFSVLIFKQAQRSRTQFSIFPCGKQDATIQVSYH